jgi:putative flippase GtrA
MTSSSPTSSDDRRRTRDLRSFARFVVAGGINTAASYALFVALELVLPYVAAYAIAYVAGIVLSYLLNTGLVFRVPRRWSTFLRFPLVYVVQFLLGSGVIIALVEGFAMSPRMAALLALVATVPVTFLAARFVLRPSQGDA